MSIKEQRLALVQAALLRHHRLSLESGSRWVRYAHRLRTWMAMLQFEWLKNDVAIRAESLSYYTLFSFMPLMAGVFLLLGFFSQWGPVQQEFEGLLGRALGAIPEDQRKTLLQFILQFKDQYLANLSRKSGSIGIFAVGILLWIGARVFFNIESLMNRIWEVREERAWWDRVRNFFFCMVLLPIVYAATLSIPRIIEWIQPGKVNALLEQAFLELVVLTSFAIVLKSFPNTRVSWRGAGAGALVGTAGFTLAQVVLSVYFRMGTETAYGKAAVLPLFAFFIYVSWVVFILSVEVSLLVERGSRAWAGMLPEASLSKALVLERLVRSMRIRFEEGRAPASLEELSVELAISSPYLETILEFLVSSGKVLRGDSGYALVCSVTEDDLLSLIKDLLELGRLNQKFDVRGLVSRLN